MVCSCSRLGRQLVSRKILLTQHRFTLVDDADYDFLSQWEWCALLDWGNWYAVRNRKKADGPGPGLISIHRLLLGATKGQQVDHINRNGLDNRRENLRFCTNVQNAQNRKPRKGSSSRYKGVSWDKNTEAWIAQIGIDGKLVRIGKFGNEHLAAEAYDAFAIKYFGEFARPNFVGDEKGY